MSGTAKSRLQELASHLHGALAERERAERPKEVGPRERSTHPHKGKKESRTITTRVRPRGARQPKISLADNHISLSWVGDRKYHSEVWDNRVRRMPKDASVHYDVLVFYKSSQTPPQAWKEAMIWTGAPMEEGDSETDAPLDCWQEILLESYIVLTRNTAGANTDSKKSAQKAGQPTIDTKVFRPSKTLEDALTTVVPNRWFAFPGALDNDNFRPWPRRHPSRGQIIGWVPGAKDPLSSPARPRHFREGHCLFRHESDVATAIITKIYPENDEFEANSDRSRRRFKNFLLSLFILAVLFIAGAAGLCKVSGYEDADLGSVGCRACDITDAVKDLNPLEWLSGQRETDGALQAADAEADRQKVQLEAQSERIDSQSREIERLETLPRGLDEPPCWLDESGARPEFLYDISISDDEIGRAHV